MFIYFNFDDNYFLKLNEQRLDDIFPDKLIDLIYNEKDQIIGNILLLKYYQNEPQEKEYNYKKYLEILIQFYIENKEFMDLVGAKIEEIGGANEKEFFFLDKHWIDEFNYIFEYEEIYKILDSNKKILLNNDEMKIKIEQISNQISNDIKSYINNLKEEIIYEKLNNQHFYEMNNYKCTFEKNCFNFFSKCVILQQKFLNLLREKKLYSDEKIDKFGIKYLYGDNKIFLCVKIKNEQIIDIGIINEYNIFNSEIIISSDKNVQTIFEICKTKGMNYIRNLMTQNKISNANNVKFIKVKEIINEKEIKIPNIKSISNIIKTLLIIFINQYKLRNLNNILNENVDINQKFEEVLLINLSFLYQFEYDKIKNTIIKNKNIISKLKKYSSYTEEDLLNMIFKDLDLNILNEIDKNLKQFDINSIDSNNFFAKPENIILSKDKNINIYNYFIIANVSIIKILIKNLNIKTKLDMIKYLSYNGKMFIMLDYENQYSLLSGSIINDENIFKLEYIFDFKNKQYLKNGIKEIILNYNNYIKELINNNTYQNNYIFPLYIKENNKKVGLCYKYDDNIKNNNYSDLSINKKLFNIIYLYINNKIVKEKLKDKKITQFTPDIYCLVNSNWLNNYKSFYNYNKIEEEIKSNKNIQNNINKNLNGEKKNISKVIYLIIKELNPNTKNQVSQENHNQNQNDIYPKSKQIQYNSQQVNQFMIYDKFELLNRSLAKKLIGKDINLEKFYVECYLINNYIIINFPNKTKENKFLSMIGEYKKCVVIKYALIYEDEEKRKTHLQSVLNNLNNYLNNVQFYENNAPITDEKFNILGTIILIKDFNIRNNFDSCPHIGLTNIGATCYMNSTLQCFCHIEKFVNFFKCSSQVLNNQKDNLTSSFKLLIDNLWPNDYDPTVKYYAPEEFKNKISKMNDLFAGIAANDSKDLVNFIIMTLHEELNKAEKIQENNNYIPNIDQTNKISIFQNFTQDFTKRNISIISDLFYAINCNITKCGLCNTEIYNFQIYFFLIFPLEEVRKFKNECNNYNQFNQFNPFNFQNNFINNNEVNMTDCFNYNQKVNFMTGENSMYCNRCRTNCDCRMWTYLVTGPEILIIILNRGKGIEFNIKIYFEENLDLSNYIEYKNTGCNYKLIGVITHIGESSMSGHFIAYCRDPINNDWYKYNDAIVNKVENFQNEVINFAMPYLLFYQKVNS